MRIIKRFLLEYYLEFHFLHNMKFKEIFIFCCCSMSHLFIVNPKIVLYLFIFSGGGGGTNFYVLTVDIFTSGPLAKLFLEVRSVPNMPSSSFSYLVQSFSRFYKLETDVFHEWSIKRHHGSCQATSTDYFRSESLYFNIHHK